MTITSSNSTNALPDQTKVQEIPVSDRPDALACSRDGKRVFVTHNTNDGAISVIDVETSKVIKIIKVGTAVGAIAVSPDDKNVVVCWQNGAWIIDAETLEVTDAIEGAGADHSVEYSPDGKYIYLCKRGLPQLVVLDAKSLVEVHSIWNSGTPRAIAISSSKPRAYISGEQNGEILVFDTDAREVTNRIKVGNNPFDVAITGGGKLLCVCNYEDKTASFIDLEIEKVVETVDVGIWPVAVASSPDGCYVYVALNSQGLISVLDTKTFKEVARLRAGSSPYDVAVNQMGTFMYCANLASNSVSVIRLAPVVSEVVEDFEVAELKQITAVGETMSTAIFEITLLETSDPEQWLAISNADWGGEWVRGNALNNYDAHTDKMMAYSLELNEGTASTIRFWMANGNNTSLIPYLDVWFMGGPDNVLDARHFSWPPDTAFEMQVDSGALQGIQSIKIRTNGQFVIDQIEVVRE
ncbi:YVTN family beta-propeller protein [Pseudomonas corrugata]|uniref:YncE family protein n=1 Tax=Pseudomonas corrugata TaxID=47879 RepID=UPI00285C3923|nr:YncE family protein [Pseudomonas corrugata]MDR7285298.1 YVTN family beta-propeller protein [Pseudomonas corrugata]